MRYSQNSTYIVFGIDVHLPGDELFHFDDVILPGCFMQHQLLLEHCNTRTEIPLKQLHSVSQEHNRMFVAFVVNPCNTWGCLNTGTEEEEKLHLTMWQHIVMLVQYGVSPSTEGPVGCSAGGVFCILE